MKLAAHASLDALCGEYVVGTLRGAARRRFERALVDEPLVALRLTYWQRTMAVGYSTRIEVQPAAGGWRRLERELGLRALAPKWYRRLGVWRAWAVAATAALVVAVGVETWRPAPPPLATVALLEAAAGHANVTAQLSADRHLLVLSAARPVLASPQQSFELWLIPQGGAPISLGVAGSLDTRFELRPTLAAGIVAGAKLAISVEPVGGSPTGGPTGPVIAIGSVSS